MTDDPSFLDRRLEWTFPAEKTHSGIPLSNGTFGALVWGGETDVRITINREVSREDVFQGRERFR